MRCIADLRSRGRQGLFIDGQRGARDFVSPTARVPPQLAAGSENSRGGLLGRRPATTLFLRRRAVFSVEQAR
jgi:hypothetical protein